jgi:hypothetical protein
MVIIDSWFAGASGFRQIQYRVIYDYDVDDYHLEYQTNGGEWSEIAKNSDGHRVAKGLSFMIVLEDVRAREGKRERRLA